MKLRFSIRDLLWLTLLMGALCGWLVNAHDLAEEREQTKAALEASKIDHRLEMKNSNAGLSADYQEVKKLYHDTHTLLMDTEKKLKAAEDEIFELKRKLR